MKSPLCALLGIKYPVFQGGMAWVADASLAAAVSEAGGLQLVKTVSWYDNEYGFVTQLIRVLDKYAKM